MPQECTVIVDAPYEPLIRHFKQTNSLIPKLLINCYAATTLVVPLKMSFIALSSSTSIASTMSLAMSIVLQVAASTSLTLKALRPALQSVEHLHAIEKGLTARNFSIKKNYLKTPGQDLIIMEDMKAKATLLLMQMASDLAKLKK